MNTFLYESTTNVSVSEKILPSGLGDYHFCSVFMELIPQLHCLQDNLENWGV